MAINNSTRFSEIEYCLQKYFDTSFTPVMRNVQEDLNRKQLHEYAEYQTSLSGALRSMGNSMNNMPDDSMQFLKMTGKWNSKTTEDYIGMCQEQITGNKDFQKDLIRISSEWRNTIIKEIGRERYDLLSQKLGGDLAYAYVDYRVQQMMIDKLVKDRMPKSSMEYIMRKAGEGSLFGISTMLSKSSLDHEIAEKGERAYNPGIVEKGTAKVASIGIDVVSTGGCGSWANLGRFVGFDVVFNGVSYLMDKNNPEAKVMTIEDCISQGVFGSKSNLLAEFRQEGNRIKSWENPYVLSLNQELSKKMGIATEKPLIMNYIDSAIAEGISPWRIPVISVDETKEKYTDIPLIVAPGYEEAYMAIQRQQEAQTKVGNERVKDVEPKLAMQAYLQNQESAEQATKQNQQSPIQGNTEGWSGLLSNVGLDGIGKVGSNLGYVISMLPDILLGMFTGRNTTFGKRDTLMPIASILAGMFVKNPILKMTLMGLGGANLLNKAGKEATERQEGSSIAANRIQYKTYADEVLNPRIENPILQGSCLIAHIDKVPCTIQLPQHIVAAHDAGALPLNTLANAVLAKNDQVSNLAQNNYRNVETHSEEKDRTVTLK